MAAMHELPFTRNILTVAQRYAETRQAEKIVRIYLRLGILRDIQEDWLQRYFAYISKGTNAEGAEIIIMVEPVLMKCNECGEQFGIDLRQFADEDILCPKCAADDYEMVTGTEFIIQGIEVE